MSWLLRPDAMRAFENEEIAASIPRYIRVVRGERRPLFRLAQTVEVDLEGDRWKEHEEGLKALKEIVESDREFHAIAKPNLLDLKSVLAFDLASNCELCEWKCGVDRLRGGKGVCRVGEARVSTAFIHMGEEPPITPSGTIFFSGCNFKCVYCQNWDISQFPEAGSPVSISGLAEIMDELRRRGARNINLVGGEPTPNLHWIVATLRYAKEDFPIVWNSNMYMSERATELLLGLVDLWLPDFKYWSDECARKYSKVVRYRETVIRNLLMAHSFPPGEMVIRHLVLPGHLKCDTEPILRWISENMPDVLVNVMEQYRPEYKASEYKEINRRVPWEEMSEAYRLADELGLRWKSVS